MIIASYNSIRQLIGSSPAISASRLVVVKTE